MNDRFQTRFPNIDALATGRISGKVSEWPQLKAEAAQILQEIEHWCSESSVSGKSSYENAITALKTADERDNYARYAEKLSAFAMHKDGCEKFRFDEIKDFACSCGLDAVLAQRDSQHGGVRENFRDIDDVVAKYEKDPAMKAAMDSARADLLARRFHEAYERLAPSFGYETRPDTRAFDPDSANGRLMVAVCAELIATSRAAVVAEGVRLSEWMCPTCGFHNTSHYGDCCECRTTRPVESRNKGGA